MKRYGNLYERICSFENLVAAAYRARRGKRFRPDVAAFHHDLEAGLLSLRDDLRARTYRTSQFFANAYLNGFDHFLKESLGCRAYVRFSDDFLVFGDDKAWLAGLPAQMQSYMNHLRLRLHPHKCQVMPMRCGVEFLGWLVYPDHRQLRRSTGVRFQRRLRALQEDYSGGLVSLDDVRASVMSWIGHLKHGDTWGLRRKLLASALFVKTSSSPTQGTEP